VPIFEQFLKMLVELRAWIEFIDVFFQFVELFFKVIEVFDVFSLPFLEGIGVKLELVSVCTVLCHVIIHVIQPV